MARNSSYIDNGFCLDAMDSDKVATSMTKLINDFSSISSRTGSQALQSLCQRLRLAIDKLYSLSRTFEEQALTEISAEILKVCLTDIVRFITAIVNEEHIGFEDDDYMNSVACILDPKLFHCLFNLRQIFYSETIDLLHHDQGVACWVDVLLSHYSEFIVRVACTQDGFRRVSEQLPRVSREQQQHDNLRVASQLPHLWSDLPLHLASKQASPAAKRLCLSILYAAYVIYPHITGNLSCDSEKSIYLLDSLQSLALEYADQNQVLVSPSDFDVVKLRLSCSMLIALYASVEHNEQINAASFRPHTTTILSELLDSLFPRDKVPLPVDLRKGLDEPALLLLKWGYTLPWAWSKWNDARLIGFETVVSITACWLCIDILLTGKEAQLPERDYPYRVPVTLIRMMESSIRLDPQAALTSFYQQLYWESSSPLNALRLFRAIFGIRSVIHLSKDACDEVSKIAVIERLLVLFAENIDLEAGKDVFLTTEIIRCLKSIDSPIIKMGLIALRKDTKFFSKVTTIFSGFLRYMDHSRPATIFYSLLDPFFDFILLFCTAGLERQLPTSLLSLLSGLVKGPYLCQAPVRIRISLLSCLANVHAHCLTGGGTISSGKLYKTWDDEEAYNVALGISVNLDLAVSLASYLQLSLARCIDPLLVAELWDYLRDALLILADNKITKHGTEALSVTIDDATVRIVKALELIVNHGNTITVLLSSPVTTSLVESLQKIATIPELNHTLCKEAGSCNKSDNIWGSTTREACQRFLEKIALSRLY